MIEPANDPGLAIDESAFFGDLGAAASAAASARMASEREELLIAAPTRVPIDVRATLPLQVYYAATLRTMDARDLEWHAVLVAVDLTHGRVSARRALPLPERPPAALDPDDPSDVFRCELPVIEVRRQLELPWREADLLITLLLRERASNRVRIALQRSPTSYHDEEVARFVRRQRLPAPAAPWPVAGRSGALPRYGAAAGQGPPATDGVALALARGPRTLLLTGGFRLPLEPGMRVPPTETVGMADYGTPRPVAIVAITLVLLGHDELGPVVIPLRLPAHEVSVDAEGAERAVGSFALDLFALERMPKMAQAWDVFAFSGEVMVGPLVCPAVG